MGSHDLNAISTLARPTSLSLGELERLQAGAAETLAQTRSIWGELWWSECDGGEASREADFWR